MPSSTLSQASFTKAPNPLVVSSSGLGGLAFDGWPSYRLPFELYNSRVFAFLVDKTKIL